MGWNNAQNDNIGNITKRFKSINQEIDQKDNKEVQKRMATR